MGNKLTIEHVKSESLKLGTFEILSEGYVSCCTKLKVRCLRHGHVSYKSWDSIKQEIGCLKCTKLHNKQRFSHEYVALLLKKENCVLVTKRYIDNRQRLECLDSNGNTFFVRLINWSMGRRPHLHVPTIITTEMVRDDLKQSDYTLIGEYVDSRTKIKYECPKKHIHMVMYNDWKNGDRCPYCTGHSSVKLDFKRIRKSFKSAGYTLVSTECENSKSKLVSICPNGHIYIVNWGNWEYGKTRCKKCSNNVSKWEKDIQEFVSSHGIQFISNDRNVLRNPNTGMNLELDLYFPRLNKAIECNGDYWHSKEDRIRLDNIKQGLCVDKNIDLLVLSDSEWKLSREGEEQKILNFLKGAIEI